MYLADRNKKINLSKLMDNEEFRKQVQAFDKTIDCDITVIFLGVWHKIYPFSKDYALKKYINTFKKSEEYIWQHSNSRRERIASILTMKAVSAMHKAKAETRSFVWGFGIGVVSLGVAFITLFLKNINNNVYIAGGLFFVYLLLAICYFIVPVQQNESSIMSSAIDDAIESYENEFGNKNMEKITNSTSKRRKQKIYKSSHKK